jgi:hypothetical protein
VLCMDEQPVQLLQETRVPIAATKQHGKRVDYEYERHGTVSILDPRAHLYRNLRFGNNALSSNGLNGGKRECQNNPRFSYGSLRRPFWAENRPKNPFRKSKSGSWANGEFSCTAKP